MDAIVGQTFAVSNGPIGDSEGPMTLVELDAILKEVWTGPLKDVMFAKSILLGKGDNIAD